MAIALFLARREADLWQGRCAAVLLCMLTGQALIVDSG